MKKEYFLILLLTISCNSDQTIEPTVNEAESLLEEFEQLVLKQNKIQSKFFLDASETDELYEIESYYIGSTMNKINGELKFIYSTSYSGKYQESKRASSNISLYNEENICFGYYNLGGYHEQIPELIDGILIIKNVSNECNLTSEISFIDSIPSILFIECKELDGKTYGDLFNFIPCQKR